MNLNQITAPGGGRLAPASLVVSPCGCPWAVSLHFFKQDGGSVVGGQVGALCPRSPPGGGGQSPKGPACPRT